VAGESGDLWILEGNDQTLDSRISAEGSGDKSAEEEDEMPGVQEEALEIATHDSL